MLSPGDNYTSEFKEGGGPKSVLKLFSLTLWVDRRDVKENGGSSTALCIKRILEGKGGAAKGKEHGFRYCC